MADHFRQNLLHSATSRLSSEAPSRQQQQRQSQDSKRKSHLHGLHHSHKPHHRHRSSRHHAKELVQSAFPSQPPTSFGDLLKQAKESITSSPSDSRRASVAVDDGPAEKDKHTDVGGLDVPPLRRPGRPEDLAREQKKVEIQSQYVNPNHPPSIPHYLLPFPFPFLPSPSIHYCKPF